MMGRYVVLILIAFLVEGVFGDAAEVKSVMEGDPVILNTGVTKQKDDIVRWYFNDIRIAVIDGICCLYDGPDGRFRDRLMLDCKTGSLIITNITTEHTGHYEADLKREERSGKTEKLNRNSMCNRTIITRKNGNVGKIIKSFSLTVSASDSGKNKNEDQIVPQDKETETSSGSASGLSSGAVAGIVIGVLLLAAAVVVGVMICRSRNDMKKNKQVLEQVSEDESFLQAQNGKV